MFDTTFERAAQLFNLRTDDCKQLEKELYVKKQEKNEEEARINIDYYKNVMTHNDLLNYGLNLDKEYQEVSKIKPINTHSDKIIN